MLCHSLALFLASLSLSAEPAPAGSGARERAEVAPAVERRLQLVVADAPGQDRGDMEYWLKQSSDNVFRQHAIPEVPPDEEPPWKIRVEVSGHAYAYRSSVTLVKAGAKEGPPPPLVECTCTTEDFLRSVEERMHALVRPELAPSPRPPSLLPVTSNRNTDPVVAPSPAPLDDTSPQARRGGFGGFGIAGVVVTAAGLGAFGYGLDRRVRDGERVDRPAGDMVLHYRTPGTDAAFGIGIAAVGIGVALIVVDQAVCKKRPRGCRPSRPKTLQTARRF